MRDYIKNKILLVLAFIVFSLPGCSANTTDNQEPSDVGVCAWASADATVSNCPEDAAFSNSRHFELIDDGESACWLYAKRCTRLEVDPATAPQCERTWATCQPTNGGTR